MDQLTFLVHALEGILPVLLASAAKGLVGCAIRVLVQLAWKSFVRSKEGSADLRTRPNDPCQGGQSQPER